MKKTVKQSPASILAKELDWEDSKAKPWGQVANYHGWTTELIADEHYSWDQFLDQDFACSLFWDDSYNQTLATEDEKHGLCRMPDAYDEPESVAAMIDRVGALYEYVGLGRSDGVTLVITKETRWAEWGKGSKGIRRAKQYLAVVKKEFQRVADSEVYGIQVNDPSGQHGDSCWGFIGHEYAQEQAAQMLLDNATYTEGKDCNGNLTRQHLKEEPWTK